MLYFFISKKFKKKCKGCNTQEVYQGKALYTTKHKEIKHTNLDNPQNPITYHMS